MVARWVTLVDKSCVSMGKSSRGFLVKRKEFRLDSRKKYVIKIISQEDYYRSPKCELVGIKMQKVKEK